MTHDTRAAHSHPHPDQDSSDSNGVLGKISKVSPLVTFVAALGIGGVSTYYVSQQNAVAFEAKVSEKVAALEAAVASLSGKVDKVTQDVVPRSEHFATQQVEKERDYWHEKYDDLEKQDLQRQIDEIRRR